MKAYKELSREELVKEFELVKAKYQEYKGQNLSLTMARGNPCLEQLKLSEEMFHLVNENAYLDSIGTDCRNYGGLDGLGEMKEIFSGIFGVDKSQVIVGGNSSLNMMFDTIAQFMTHGSYAGGTPWMQQGEVKFLCPAPGYDRHFKICEHFGIKMINIAINSDGPDMDVIEELVKDPSVKGMWCVPKYSNPTGAVYSDEVIERLAKLKPASKDFRILWDNAYCIHHLTDEEIEIMNISEAAKKYDNEDIVIKFASTSKVTFPGAGVAAMASSPANIAHIKNRMSFQTIGPDKLNHLRHAKMFKTLDDMKAHMVKHAEIIAPKFQMVVENFENELAGLGIANWTNPKGGYFISLDVLEGCAKRVVSLCQDAGVVLTGAGATYPYGIDPKDSNIRVAPTFPSLADLKLACELLCVAVKYASLEKILG